MIDYFPTRLIPIARRWWTQNGSISRNDVYNMAEQAGASLEEMEAAIAYMLDHHEEPDPRLITTDYDPNA